MADPFDTVEPLTLEPCDASPALPEEGHDGIRIACPARVAVGGRFILCGAMRLRSGEFGLLDPGTEVKVVAVEAAGRSTFAGPAYRDESYVLGAPELQQPSEIRARSWFNADLFDNLMLPRRAGTWFVHAYLGPFVSNAAVVEVVEDDA